MRLDKDAGCYVIEAAFPLKTDGYDLSKARVQSLNLMRNVFNKNSFRAIGMSGWAPMFYTARDADSRGLIWAA